MEKIQMYENVVNGESKEKYIDEIFNMGNGKSFWEGEILQEAFLKLWNATSTDFIKSFKILFRLIIQS